MMTGKNFLAGQWRGATGKTFTSTNPARNSETIGTFPLGSKGDAEEAVAAARKAYPAWRRTSRILRAELFDHLAQIVKRETDHLAKLMRSEERRVGKECRSRW